MKQLAWQILVAGSTYLWCLFISSSVRAQVTSDNTVSTNVSKTGNVFEITGGKQVGGNLFHSFHEFSVPTGSEAFFFNAANTNTVSNIISRITGGSISNIDGLLKENYGANLILINPSGINFGSNARLDISGSFLASTANSLKFADGTEYSAINPQTSPTLTISIPVGLQLGRNSGLIRVQGIGHNLTVDNSLYSPSNGGSTEGLTVQPGQTLALIGAGVTLEGGTLTAKGGRIELGSVGEGLVSLSPNSQGWTFSYQGLSNFEDIGLSQKALVDTSGVGGGGVQLQGQNISIRDGSAILIQNQGSQSARSINVNASSSLNVTGTTPDGKISSGLFTQTQGSGNSGDITISTPNLNVEDGAEISAATVVSPIIRQIFHLSDLPSGASGNITINTNQLKVSRGAQITTSNEGTGNSGNVRITASSILLDSGGSITSELGGTFKAGQLFFFSPITLGANQGGDIRVSTQQLVVQGIAAISTASYTNATGGNIIIDAPQSVQVIGTSSLNPNAVSFIGSSWFSVGNSGNISISTGQFTVLNGGLVSASTFGSGTGGNVNINATKSVAVIGTDPSHLNPSQVTVSTLSNGNGGNLAINSPTVIVKDGGKIDSGANIPSQTMGQIFHQMSQLSGSSGDIIINTNQLSVTNGGHVTVNNQGTGNAGTLKVSANSIFLDNQGSITAVTQSGEGGNIVLEAKSFQLRHQSQISAQAGGSGNGGNITIGRSTATDFLALLEGSFINANAYKGMGGSISIRTPGLFLCSNCQITTSSTLGLNGLVQIISPETRANFKLVDLPQQVTKPEQVVAQACPAHRQQNQSQLLVSGRGGLPTQPDESLSSEALVSFDPPPTHGQNSSVSLTATDQSATSILPPPARGWYTNREGVVILTAQSPTATPYSSGLSSLLCLEN